MWLKRTFEVIGAKRNISVLSFAFFFLSKHILYIYSRTHLDRWPFKKYTCRGGWAGVARTQIWEGGPASAPTEIFLMQNEYKIQMFMDPNNKIVFYSSHWYIFCFRSLLSVYEVSVQTIFSPPRFFLLQTLAFAQQILFWKSTVLSCLSNINF